MSAQPRTHAYDAMGTHWQLTIWDTLDDALFGEIIDTIVTDTRRFESLYSRFDKESLVWTLSKMTGKTTVPEELVKMLRTYEDLGDCSGGKCNPLVGFSLSDMGYDEKYSLQEKETVRPTPAFRDAVSILDDSTIHLKERVLIDVGALGKGFFVDTIAAYLRNLGIKRFLVDGSGDIAYEGDGHTISAGLEHPGDEKQVIGVAEFTRGALCGSASNRRRWGKQHHIIDPHTLESADYIIATWVLAENAALADGLATCLFFTEPERYEGRWPFEYCIVNKDMHIKSSPGFPAKLF